MGIRRIHVFGNRHYPRVIGYRGHLADIRHYQKADSDITDFDINIKTRMLSGFFCLHKRVIHELGTIARTKQKRAPVEMPF